MKVLLATTMALGVFLMLGANQPTYATVTQPAVSAYHQNHATQAQTPDVGRRFMPPPVVPTGPNAAHPYIPPIGPTSPGNAGPFYPVNPQTSPGNAGPGSINPNPGPASPGPMGPGPMGGSLAR